MWAHWLISILAGSIYSRPIQTLFYHLFSFPLHSPALFPSLILLSFLPWSSLHTENNVLIVFYGVEIFDNNYTDLVEANICPWQKVFTLLTTSSSVIHRFRLSASHFTCAFIPLVSFPLLRFICLLCSSFCQLPLLSLFRGEVESGERGGEQGGQGGGKQKQIWQQPEIWEILELERVK